MELSRTQKFSLFFSRIVLGWLFFYAGITKVLDTTWSAAGYLKGAKLFQGLYAWLASPGILPVVNFLNEWGLTLIGAALILGLFVRLSSVFGIFMMLLYYLPILDFPYPNPHSFLVDEHIVYTALFLVFIGFRAGRAWGLENWCAKLPICSKFPRFRAWLG